MSRSIDHRIVEMQFNNRQFESALQDTLRSLAELRKGLELDRAGKGLTDLEDIANKFTLGNIAENVDDISNRFSLLGIIAVTALVNIANSAIETGKQLVKALSTDNIAAGFAKYEQKTQAVQTILNATGQSLEEVNAILEKLMWFTDETSYSFADMVTNIGKFTGSGVKLEVAADAMQGIATWAALSGQNTHEASRAMYILANSISQGSVRLLQWRSIENANMATKEFRETAIKTAIAMGTLSKEGKTAKGTLVDFANFSTTLHEDWFTADVLLETLQAYGGYATEVFEYATEHGVTAAQAMRALGLDTETLGARAFKAAQQAKTFSEAIEATKDAVSSGWMVTSEILFGDYHEAVELWSDFTDALWELFASGAEARNEMLQAWKDMGGRDDAIEAFWNIWEAVDNIRLTIKDAFQEIFPPMTAEKLFAITEALKEFTARFKMGEETADNVRRIFRGLFSVLDFGKQIFTAVAKGVGKVISAFTGGTGVLSFLAKFGDVLFNFNQAFKNSDILGKSLEILGKGIDSLAAVVKTAGGIIMDFFGSFGAKDTKGIEIFTQKVGERFEALQMKLNFSSGTGKFQEFVNTLKRIFPVVFKIAERIAEAFKKMQQAIINALNSNDVGNMFEVIVGFFSVSVAHSITIFLKSLKDITEGVGDILWAMYGVLKAYQYDLNAKTLIKIATAIGILAVSLLILATIDAKRLAVAIAAMGTLFAQLFGSMLIFQKLSGKAGGFFALLKMSSTMLAFSTAILIMAVALKAIASIPQKRLLGAVFAIGALMAMLLASAKLMNANKMTLTRGMFGYILLAGAIVVLTTAVKKLAQLDFKSLVKGLVGVGVLLAELALFMKFTNFTGLGAGQAAGIVVLAVAISLLANSVKKFSEIPATSLIKGLVAMGVLLGELVIFSKVIGTPDKIVVTASGLLILGLAMGLFANAIAKLGGIPLEQLGAGLLAMAGALTIITIAMRYMPVDILAKGAGLVLIAGSMILLAKALHSLGSLTWEQIAKGMVALGGAMLIFVLAMKAISMNLTSIAALISIATSISAIAIGLNILGAMSWGAILKSLAGLAGIFVVLGVAGTLLGPLVPVLFSISGALMLFGAAMFLAGAGMSLFGAGLTAVALAGSAAIASLILAITGILGLIPVFFQQLGAGLLSLARVIIEGMPVIGALVVSLVHTIIDAIVQTAPKIIFGLMTLMTTLIQAITETFPRWIEMGAKMVLAMLTGIASNIAQIVAAAVDIVANFLLGIASRISAVIDAAFKLVIAFINGLSKAISSNSKELAKACAELVAAIVKAIAGAGPEFVKVGVNIIQGMISGIKSMLKSLVNAALGVVKDATQKVKDWLGIKSPSTLFAKIGEQTGEGLALGLESMGKRVSRSSEQVGADAFKAMKKSFERIAEVVDEDVDISPVITPVLDLEEVKSQLKETFDNEQQLDIFSSKLQKAALADLAASKSRYEAEQGGDQTSTSNEYHIQVTNHYTVRSDEDIRRISVEQKNLLDRYSSARGLAVV